MNLNRNSRSPANGLAKLSPTDLEGNHRAAPVDAQPNQDQSAHAVLPADFLLEDAAIEAVQAELYPEILPPLKKHSSDRHRQKNRQKVRQIAEARLTQLSDELLKLADEVRYYHPLMAEAIDDAWDATEEAISLMASET